MLFRGVLVPRPTLFISVSRVFRGMSQRPDKARLVGNERYSSMDGV